MKQVDRAINSADKIMAKSLKRKPQSRKKIFIVEDHPVFREGLIPMLNREDDLIVCGAAGNYEQALKGIVRLKPDLVLVDITLPGKSGLELIKKLRAANNPVKLLIVSMHDEALYADRVLRAGGDGYIMKQEDPEEIIHAIRDVLRGHIYVSDAVMTRSAKPTSDRPEKTKARLIDQLTDAELEVLELLGRGNSNSEIARHLAISVRAVSAHIRQIKGKLNLESANALIRFAVCWIETGPA